MFAKKSLEQVNHLAEQVAPMLDRVSEQAGVLVHRGVDGVQDMSQMLREKARRTSSRAVGYVKDEPVKALLIAAVAGAALVALVSLMSRSRDRH